MVLRKLSDCDDSDGEPYRYHDELVPVQVGMPMKTKKSGACWWLVGGGDNARSGQQLLILMLCFDADNDTLFASK